MKPSVIILIIIVTLFLSIAWLFISKNQQDLEYEEFERLEEEIDILNNLIISKQEQFLALERDTKELKETKKQGLPPKIMKVLSIYEGNYIKVPYDIIDDLTQQQFTTEKQIIDFIETERKNWILENRKKLRREG